MLLILFSLIASVFSYQFDVHRAIAEWGQLEQNQDLINAYHDRRALREADKDNIVAKYAQHNRRTESDTIPHCNVVIIGGGSSGSHSAMFVMDNNLTVCVFEETEKLGGHCDTQYFNTTGFPNWIDIGVAIYKNTTWNNVHGYGNFTLDMATYISRWTTIIPYPAFSTPSFDQDLKGDTGLTFVPAPSPEYVAAVEEFSAQVNALYPWLETGEYPNTMPDELAMPFRDYLDANILNITRFTRQFMMSMTSGAMSPISEVPTLYAFEQLLPSFMLTNSQGGLLFGMLGGCQTVYDSIQDRLESTLPSHRSLYLNSKVTKIVRPSASSSDPILVKFKIDGLKKKVTADKLIIAIPQFLDNLDFLDLSNKEEAAFEPVKYFPGYFAVQLRMETNTTIPLVLNRDFSNTANYFETDFPDITLTRFTGAAEPFYATFAVATDDISNHDMKEVIKASLVKQANLPNPVNMTFVKMIRHIYWPHFDSDTLKYSKPYRALNRLQGDDDTYYVGALLTYADTTLIANHAYKIVQKLVSEF